MPDVLCASCDYVLADPLNSSERVPCPRCGSTSRRIYELVEEEIQAGNYIVSRAYAGGTSKRKGFKWEASAGVEISKNLGRFVTKTRLIDKVADRYVERIFDPVTGEVLRDVDELLSEHRGRGSARLTNRGTKMDPLSAAATITSLVGLMSDFMAHRNSSRVATLDEFQGWLGSNRHDELVNLLGTNQRLAISLKALFSETGDKLISKLEALDAALAKFASGIEGFAEIAATVRPESSLSAQAIHILKRMKEGGTSKVLHHHRGFAGGVDLVGMDGAAGTIGPEEQRFIEDDLEILVSLGLLRESRNGKGESLFHYTRAAEALLNASG